MTPNEALIDKALRKATPTEIFAHAKAVITHPDRVAIVHILEFAGECNRRHFYATEGELLRVAGEQRFAAIRNYLPIDEKDEYPE